MTTLLNVLEDVDWDFDDREERKEWTQLTGVLMLEKTRRNKGVKIMGYLEGRGLLVWR